MSKVAERAQHRLFGCLAGGAAALTCIGLPLTELSPWLFALGAGIWLAAYLQASARGVGYVGTQFGMVYAITFVQGFGPSTSIWPGVDRLAGILFSLALFFLVSAFFWSPEEAAAPRDLDELRADLLQRVEEAKTESAAGSARSKNGLRSEFAFWTFLVALLALAGAVAATTGFVR